MGSSIPFISLCIPAYKRPELLIRLLRSVEMQSFSDYEIIISDDTPGDEVKQAMDGFSHLPIRYFKNEPAAGMPANWNLAMQKAEASWIQLLHADDWYASKDTLAEFAAVCKSTAASFVFCASKEVNNKEEEIKTLELSKAKRKMLEDNPVSLVYENMIGHPSVVLHKKDNSIQYNTTFKWVVDIDFYIRFLEKHPLFEYIGKPLMNIGIDEEQVSFTAYKNPDVEIPEYLQLISGFPRNIREKNIYVFRCLWNLVKKFRIKDWSYINEHGYTGQQMKAIDHIIRCQQKIPRIILKQTAWSAMLAEKCFKRWMRKKK